jgi:hypothetical protein
VTLLAAAPVAGVVSGFVRAIQARRARAPENAETPAGVVILKWLRRLPLIYAGTILGAAAGTIALMQLPETYGFAAFILCSVIGMTGPYMLFRENPGLEAVRGRQSSAVRGLIIWLLVGMLAWGVPMGIVFTPLMALLTSGDVHYHVLQVDRTLLTLAARVFGISLAGGAAFGFIMWLFVTAIAWSLPKKSPADTDR